MAEALHLRLPFTNALLCVLTFLDSLALPRGQHALVCLHRSRHVMQEISQLLLVESTPFLPLPRHASPSLPPLPSRPPDQTREKKVDLSSKLGKTQVVTAASTPSQQGGWYCETCKCGLKDSINYLDHINGKKHQRELGYSMRVERSTVSQVRRLF